MPPWGDGYLHFVFTIRGIMLAIFIAAVLGTSYGLWNTAYNSEKDVVSDYTLSCNTETLFNNSKAPQTLLDKTFKSETNNNSKRSFSHVAPAVSDGSASNPIQILKEHHSLREHINDKLPEDEKIFSIALNSGSGLLAQVLDDMAIAYAAKCRVIPTYAHYFALSKTAPAAKLMALSSLNKGMSTNEALRATDQYGALSTLYSSFSDFECDDIAELMPNDLCTYQGRVIPLGTSVSIDTDNGPALAECQFANNKPTLYFF